MLKPSPSCVELISLYEGFEAHAYPDPATGAEPITIGYGTTVYHDGTKVRMGDTITEDEAVFELLHFIEHEISNRISSSIKVNLSQDQIDAILCFCYNVGFSAFLKSTFLKAINNQDFERAQSEILKWNKAGGRVMRGLTRRRLTEAVCFGPLGREALIEIYLDGVDPDIKR